MEFNFTKKRILIGYQTSLQFSPYTALDSINDSWVEPGHLAATFVNAICASQIIWTLTELKCFLSTNKNSSSQGAFIVTCVQAIATITFGKPDIAANCILMLACYVWESNVPPT